MNNKRLPAWESVHTIGFDFDGIFTNNKLFLDEHGQESVQCDRGDGLAFDLLRKFIIKNNWELDYFILSKETNNVVKKRAEKLRVKCYQGIDNKLKFVQQRLKNNSKNFNGFVYLGNDLNDLEVILKSSFSVAPSDAHSEILKNVDLVLKQKGGEGFVRRFVEELINIGSLSANDIIELIN
tara:strand:- start:202 stop:744 length:543 start_codon:yes stop_codon:yes gene_type:complete